MTIKTQVLFALTLFACAGATANELGLGMGERRNEVWLDTGFATYHFKTERELTGRNPGVGLEYKFSESMAFTAGRFYNSNGVHSKYAGLYYQPWQYRGVRLGGVVSAFDGYPGMRNGGWFVAVIPALTWEHKRVGINLAVVPNYKQRLHGGLSVQLKLKLWE